MLHEHVIRTISVIFPMKLCRNTMKSLQGSPKTWQMVACLSTAIQRGLPRLHPLEKICSQQLDLWTIHPIFTIHGVQVNALYMITLLTHVALHHRYQAVGITHRFVAKLKFKKTSMHDPLCKVYSRVPVEVAWCEPHATLVVFCFADIRKLVATSFLWSIFGVRSVHSQHCSAPCAS